MVFTTIRHYYLEAVIAGTVILLGMHLQSERSSFLVAVELGFLLFLLILWQRKREDQTREKRMWSANRHHWN